MAYARQEKLTTTFFFVTFFIVEYRATNGTKKKVIAFWGDYVTCRIW